MDILVEEKSFTEIIVSNCDILDTSCDAVAVTSDPLVLVLLLLSSVNVLTMLGWSVYLAVRAAKARPSRRQLFLCQVLLMGLVLGSVLGPVYAGVVPSTSTVG